MSRLFVFKERDITFLIRYSFGLSDVVVVNDGKRLFSESLKRPRSAYNYFSQAMFSKIKDEDVHKTSNDVMKEVLLIHA